jgi:segregation and condensation protein B
MKKRKGDKSGSEGEVQTVLASEPPASVLGDNANGSRESDSSIVDVSEDDITNRLSVSTADVGSVGAAIDGVALPDDATDGLALAAAAVDGASEETPLAAPVDGSHIERILESLLFAADRPLTLSDLKRLLSERDGKRVTAALEVLRVRHDDSGIQLVSVAGGWQLRTHPANGAWVAKLVAARPPRLSRAMMETLSIVAYRQPITRPEIDEIRGVDCGPVLRTLLDRDFIRVIGKKEEVGRPILYGTTPEFLKTFSLRDLTELPSLREFHELGADDRAKVDATGTDPTASESAEAGLGDIRAARPAAGSLSHADPEEEDSLLGELDRAAIAAAEATRSFSDRDANSEVAPGASDPGER